MSISSWPPLSLTCDEGLPLIVMVVVTGLDAVDALVGNCDNVDTIANGLVFDCGTGFCTTGVAVNSRLSFTDITCNTTVTSMHREDILFSYSIGQILSLDHCKL